jgi:hypothetical protein
MKKNIELEKNFEWYIQNINNLAKKYPEKYIAIKDCKVLGAYATFNDALESTEKSGVARGTLIVQKASTDPSAYTISYHNNLIKVV